MTTYILRRLLQSLLVLFIVSLLVFFMMRLLPGDPIRMMVSQSEEQLFTEQQLDQLRHEFGLDRPLMVQYFSWVGGLFRGDLGSSILTRQPVSEEMTRRIPITMHVGLTAFVVGLVVGTAAGVVAAVRRGSWIDSVVTALSNIGITVPVFWLGVMLIYTLGLHLKWLPIGGYVSPFDDFWASMKSLVMPVTCLALFPITSNARQARSSMLEVMRQDYIQTAWAKGLRERSVIIRHALKNGLIPVVTLSGISLSIVVGGSVIVETVFNIPGLGRLLIDSVSNQDYPNVQGIILFVATLVLLINLLVDLLYGWLDPRIRYVRKGPQ